LVLRTLYLALTARFSEHQRWARWTLPLWLYVSITGVVIYEMLY
jgi:putative membrane protein